MKLIEQNQNKAETEALDQVMADEWRFMKHVEDELAAADQVIAEDLKFRQDMEDSVAEVSEKLPDTTSWLTTITNPQCLM